MFLYASLLPHMSMALHSLGSFKLNFGGCTFWEAKDYWVWRNFQEIALMSSMIYFEYQGSISTLVEC